MALVDETGRKLSAARLPEGVEGIAKLHALVARHGSEELEPTQVLVGIETDRGPWVQALIAAGYRVYAVNPKQVARFKERYGTSGAKSDKGDAHVLADMVRIDRDRLRPVAGDSEQAQAVKVVARAHQTLIWERTRTFQRLRTTLREYYAAALSAYADLELTSTDALELLIKAPTPAAGAKLTRTQITAVLARHRRHHRDAKATTVQSALREKQLGLPEPVTSAYAVTATAHARLIIALNEQIAAMEGRVKAHLLKHPDAEIYLSMPGIAEITGARVLAEFGDDPTRYASAKARKTTPAPVPSPAPRARATPSRPATSATTASPTPSSARRSALCALHLVPAATTTSNEHARPATTPPSASSATASSASSTAASKPAPTTTKRPLGRTTPNPMPLDTKRQGVSDRHGGGIRQAQRQGRPRRHGRRAPGCSGSVVAARALRRERRTTRKLLQPHAVVRCLRASRVAFTIAREVLSRCGEFLREPDVATQFLRWGSPTGNSGS